MKILLNEIVELMEQEVTEVTVSPGLLGKAISPLNSFQQHFFFLRFCYALSFDQMPNNHAKEFPLPMNLVLLLEMLHNGKMLFLIPSQVTQQPTIYHNRTAEPSNSLSIKSKQVIEHSSPKHVIVTVSEVFFQRRRYDEVIVVVEHTLTVKKFVR